MPTPPKSIAALKLSGTFQRNPARYKDRDNPVLTDKTLPKTPLGSVPTHLPAPERAIWAEVVKAAPKGLLSRSHRVAVEVLVGLIAKLRAGTIKPGEVNTLLTTLSKFGLSPEAVPEPVPEPLPASTEKTAEQLAWDELDQFD